MPEIINISIATSTKSGPELKAAWQISPPTYEKIQLDVKNETKTLVLTSGEQIQLLVIAVGPGDGQVTYKVNGGSSVTLKQPQVALYQAGMLPSADKIELEFNNADAKAVSIDVLAARALP